MRWPCSHVLSDVFFRNKGSTPDFIESPNGSGSRKERTVEFHGSRHPSGSHVGEKNKHPTLLPGFILTSSNSQKHHQDNDSSINYSKTSYTL
jgi:hypothetical protein